MLEKLRKHGWTDSDLCIMFDISLPTLKKYETSGIMDGLIVSVGNLILEGDPVRVLHVLRDHGRTPAMRASMLEVK